jgi:hypothetical protein
MRWNILNNWWEPKTEGKRWEKGLFWIVPKKTSHTVRQGLYDCKTEAA